VQPWAVYHAGGGLFISVLTNPTMGGSREFRVSRRHCARRTAGARRFAGPRVVKQTIKAELPEGFQTSEFMLAHGFVDRIVSRPQLRTEIARVIDYCVK